MPRTIELLPTPVEACSRILALAEPGEPIEVSLVDALGLVLAEPAVADVDLPPFDRASTEGYAVRAAEARAGALLRVAGLRGRAGRSDEALEAGEAIRARQGDPMPVGADAVVRLEDVRPDPETGPTRVIEVLRAVEPGQDVSRRGLLLEAGAILAPAGTRLKSLDGRPARRPGVRPPGLPSTGPGRGAGRRRPSGRAGRGARHAPRAERRQRRRSSPSPSGPARCPRPAGRARSPVPTRPSSEPPRPR